MTRFLLAAFLVGHGFIHGAMWTIPPDPNKPAPFDPKHSWALTAAHVAQHPTRTLASFLAWTTAVVFGASGVALLTDSTLWVPLAATGAAVGLLLKGLFFNTWLLIGVGIDVAVLWAASAGWPESLT